MIDFCSHTNSTSIVDCVQGYSGILVVLTIFLIFIMLILISHNQRKEGVD